MCFILTTLMLLVIHLFTHIGIRDFNLVLCQLSYIHRESVEKLQYKDKMDATPDLSFHAAITDIGRSVDEP